MTSPLFVSERCQRSRRSAIVSEDGHSVWLYLTAPDAGAVERDCWLFNTPVATDRSDPQWYRERSLPPPAPPDLVASGGIREPGSIREWSFEWSAAGEAVIVLADGEPLGFVALSISRGLSRFLLRSSPWGNPWEDAIIERCLAGPG